MRNYVLVAGRNPASKWYPEAPKERPPHGGREPRNGRPLTAQQTTRASRAERPITILNGGNKA